MSIGFGYDVHKFVEHRKLILGGVEIPFEKGLLGHSDADALLHAICDALLGAAALGDIGTHFPDTDVRFKNISSLTLLALVWDMIKHANFRVVNIDSTVVLESPKIAPYVEKMRERIADALQLDRRQVSVKATTSEGMGFTGTGEGVAAYAVALLEWH
jgi:2-C-methyl-D-erythritol 2,4-cyclodiphosphate synthase